MAITTQTNVTLAEIARVIEDHDDFVLCGHVSPDGDCLGSQLALFHALKALGKNAACVLVKDEAVGMTLSFMPGMQDMVPAESYDGPAKTFIALDVPVRDRIGSAVDLLDACELSITIDHHAADETMSDYVFVDPDAASASILVWEVVKELCPEPPRESALCAYAGLFTDTGGFKFQNSNAEAFRAASDLVAHGADPAFVAVQVFQNRTLASLKLESLVIGRMEVFHDGEGVISWVTRQDMEQLGAVKSDAEPLIDAIRSLAGIRVACILREQEDCIRGSLRAKDDTDVSALARSLGGGGHKAAAGITLHGDLDENVKALRGKLEALLSGATFA